MISSSTSSPTTLFNNPPVQHAPSPSPIKVNFPSFYNAPKEHDKQTAVNAAFNKPAWNEQARQMIALLKNTFSMHFRIKNVFSGKSEHIERSLNQVRKFIEASCPHVQADLSDDVIYAHITKYVIDNFGQTLLINEQGDLSDLLTDLYTLAILSHQGKLTGTIDIDGQIGSISSYEDRLEIPLPKTYRRYMDTVELFKAHQCKHGGILSTLAYELGVDDETLDNMFAPSADILATFQKLKIWLEKVKPGLDDTRIDNLTKQAARHVCNLLKKLSPHDEARRFIEELIVKLSEIADTDDRSKRREDLYVCVCNILDFISKTPGHVNNLKSLETTYDKKPHRRGLHFGYIEGKKKKALDLFLRLSSEKEIDLDKDIYDFIDYSGKDLFGRSLKPEERALIKLNLEIHLTICWESNTKPQIDKKIQEALGYLQSSEEQTSPEKKDGDLHSDHPNWEW